MSFDSEIAEFLTNEQENLSRKRRQFHRHPEIGWTEYLTTCQIADELEDLNFELTVGRDALESSARLGVPDSQSLARAEEHAREAGASERWIEKVKGGHTGLVAQWETGRPGPHIALRFDIDALPIRESDDDGHTPFAEGFRSGIEGAMHACGHDGHASIGLGVASFLARCEEHLCGRFTLLFQPSEEGARGARAMVERGWLDDADYFIAGHIGVTLKELGVVAATTSGFLPTTKMDVRFRGRSAHAGGEPQEGRNALLAAASAALHLHSISRHGDGPTRVNIGTLAAGTGRNVVADFAEMQLETRGATRELNEYMAGEARRVVHAAAEMHGVEAELEVVGEGMGAACDDEWKALLREACQGAHTIDQVLPEAHLGGSEDATFMMDRVQRNGGKATYLLFGSPLTAGHHNPAFDYEERALIVGTEALARLIRHLCAA